MKRNLTAWRAYSVIAIITFFSVAIISCDNGTGAGNSPRLLFERTPDGGYSITRDRDRDVFEGALVIPATHNGLPVIAIGEIAFSNNRLTSVTIPDSVQTIGANAFRNNQLTSLIIHDNVQTIGDWAFASNRLTSVIIPDSGITIGDWAFWDNQLLTSVIILDGATSIGQGAFMDNPRLTCLTIGNGVTFNSVNINDSVFWANFGLSPITSLTVGLANIGITMFSNNSYLTNVTILDSVQTIGNQAFWNNSRLESVTIPFTSLAAADAAWGGIGWRNGIPVNAFIFNSGLGTEGLVFTRSGAGYMITNFTGTATEVFIPATHNGYPVISIGAMAFANDLLAIAPNRIISVAIPDSIISIGDGAFVNNALTNVIIPDSVTSIGGMAFWMNELASVTIGSSVQTIGLSAFSDNDLINVDIPDSVISIGNAAFQNNYLVSVDIGSNVQTIGDAAFRGNELTNVDIPNSVVSIGNTAFQNNELASITIGSNVQTIGNWAFEVNNLTNIVIPSSVASIGQGAFQNNPLDSVTIPFASLAGADAVWSVNPLNQWREGIPGTVTWITSP